MTQSVSDAEFYKWRCLVALAHADGKVTVEERSLLQNRFAQVPFTPVQLEVLEDDTKEPHDAALMFSKIEDEQHRVDLVHLAHLLFWADGEFHESEKKLFELLKRHAKDGYDAGNLTDIKGKKDRLTGKPKNRSLVGAFFEKLLRRT